MQPKISVVVCTYNRANLLTTCLQSLIDQVLDPNLWEVIIINNNSTDNTQSIIDQSCQNQTNFRAFIEMEQGLSNARNRGWREAEGQYVAFIDDDAKAESDWLEEMNAFTLRHPEVQAFGGPYDAFSDRVIPDWFPPEVGKDYLGNMEKKVAIGQEWLSGTNMVFTRELLQRYGGFDPNLGMNGEKVGYGEETRLLLQIDAEGLPIYYIPGMKVHHYVQPYKIDLDWLLKAAYASGQCAHDVFDNNVSIIHQVLRLGKVFLMSVKKMLLLRGIPHKRKKYYALADIYYQLGVLSSYKQR